MNQVREKNIRKIWKALPGTTWELYMRTGISQTTVRKYLRAWLDRGDIYTKTRWSGRLSHSPVYYPNVIGLPPSEQQGAGGTGPEHAGESPRS